MKAHGAYSPAEAATYDADRETEALWLVENDYVHSLVSRVGAASVLDAPVGTGRFLNLFGSATVTGVDLSDAMLAEASKRVSALGLSNVSLRQGSVTALPFDDAQFDLVISWRLLHLLPPDLLPAALAELARVCRGTLCIQTYERASLPIQLLAKAKRWKRRLSLISAAKRQLTPWSHIRSYAHSREDFALAASRAGIGAPSHHDRLGDYEGTRVMALVWTFHR